MRHAADPLREIPPGIRNISAVPALNNEQHIPINLLLLIISWLDDAGDLARLTRTSRLLYYVTLPKLYERITLCAYPALKYVDGHPQGFGGGSPFAMALDALISSPNNVGQYMKTLRLCGAWKEIDVDNFEKGVIPDNTMILHVALKAAITRAPNLESFIWELNMKPMKTIYQGLASRSSLSSLKLVFPLDRIPKPAVRIPALPHLKHLYLANLDPLRYNDDVSLLLFEAQLLETLKLHWNPRMRNEREPSVNLYSYFGQLIASPRMLKLKTLAMANLFSKNQHELKESISFSNLRTMTFLNCMNQDDPATIFTDSTWDVQGAPQELVRAGLANIRVVKFDTVGASVSRLITMLSDLEEIYLVTPANHPSEESPSESPKAHTETGSNGTTKPHTPAESTNSGVTPRQGTTPISAESIQSEIWKNPATRAKHVLLASDYIAALTSNHSRTITKLIIPNYWNMGVDVAIKLISRCPNLEQISLSLEETMLEQVRACCQAGPKLKVIKFHQPPSGRSLWEDMDTEETRIHSQVLGYEFRKPAYDSVRWIGFGQVVVELRGMAEPINDGAPFRSIRLTSPSDPGLKDVEIFAFDNLDL